MTNHPSDDPQLQLFLSRAFGPIKKTHTIKGILLEMRSAGALKQKGEEIPLFAFAIPDKPSIFQALTKDEAISLIGENEFERLFGNSQSDSTPI